jgi:BirA family transcriptional regulator, biotin operon repressor / biotin---[acetyl-CoA-carboxylase] ligase
MDQPSLESALADLHLPAIHYFPSIDSTNDEAWRWINAGAPHGALVIADEQTAGRGRFKHHWVTPVGSGLAFSLVFISPPLNSHVVQLLTGMGALAICNALQAKYTLPAQIKWPNDVLLNQRKVAGVLVEVRWNGGNLNAAIIGIGINIAPESISPVNLPVEGLSIPATCVENALGHSVDRLELLHAILQEVFGWLPKLSSPDFIHAWEDSLAYRGLWVGLSVIDTAQSTHPEAVSPPTQVGKVIGLASDGSLKLQTISGKLVIAQVGEIHLRPAPADHPSLPPD